jgi:hypothetical protein
MRKKNNILLFLIITLNISLFAQDVEIKLVYKDGRQQIQKLTAESKQFTFYDSEEGQIIEVKNLEKLLDLEELEVYNVSNIKDWTFLYSLKKLKSLYMSSVTVPNLQFISNMTQLENISLNVYLSKEEQDKPIDLSKLTKLKKIQIYTVPQLTSIPKLINVKNKPELDISNSMINYITENEASILKQFSVINISFSSITFDYINKTKWLKYINFKKDN